MRHRQPRRALAFRPQGPAALEPRALMTAGVDPARSLLVRFVDGVAPATERALLAQVGGQVVDVNEGGVTLVQLGPTGTPSAAITRLKSSRAVRYAEPNATLHVADVTPNDPQYPLQYALSDGYDIDIDAPAAWSITTGSPSTIVAVIDSGLDVYNPEFTNRLWINPRPDAAYPNDLHGWNFLNNTFNIADDNGHGTHVTGILAATGNNGIGVAGVDWNAKIMPLKFIDSQGNGSVDDAIRAVYFAVDHGARVINASWGGGGYSQSLIDAINYAGSHNVVFVTAAGNESSNNDVNLTFPADDRVANLISVAAVGQDGHLASFSNYGVHSVDIAAPGVNIRSTVPGGYATYSGTSMSTPYVAGVVSLLVGLHPELSAAQLVDRVVSTAKPLPALAGLVASGGIVDAYRALVGVPTATQALAAGATSPPAVHATILASAEFYALSGSTDATYIDALFRSALGRPADPGALTYWLGQLGGSNRSAIAARVLSAPEAFATTVAGWFVADLLRPAASLQALKYDPSVLAWASSLASGTTTPDAVRQAILSSAEYQAVHGANPFGYVDGLYRSALGRAADPDALAYWTSQLAGGSSAAAVAGRILAAPEARRTTIARWFIADLRRPASSVNDLKADPTVIGWAG